MPALRLCSGRPASSRVTCCPARVDTLGGGSVICYVIPIACWLPVGWPQMRLWDIASRAARGGDLVAGRILALFAGWVVPTGLHLFMGLLRLMIAKPASGA